MRPTAEKPDCGCLVLHAMFYGIAREPTDVSDASLPGRPRFL